MEQAISARPRERPAHRPPGKAGTSSKGRMEKGSSLTEKGRQEGGAVSCTLHVFRKFNAKVEGHPAYAGSGPRERTWNVNERTFSLAMPRQPPSAHTRQLNTPRRVGVDPTTVVQGLIGVEATATAPRTPGVAASSWQFSAKTNASQQGASTPRVRSAALTVRNDPGTMRVVTRV